MTSKSTAGIPDSNWSKDRLMGKSVSFKGFNADGSSTTVTSPEVQQYHQTKAKIDPMLWGRPGHLSEEEAETYVS